MTYREMVIKTVNLACQDITNRIEELVPENMDGVFGVNMQINIPTLTDTLDSLPTFKISIEGYPKRECVETMIDILREVRQRI